LLCADAKRRSQQSRQTLQHSRSAASSQKVQTLDSQSAELVYKRFLRDLGTVYTAFEFTDESTEVDKDTGFNVFVRMGFARPAVVGDQELFDTLWKQACPDGRSTTQLLNLKTLMCAIQNMHFDWMQANRGQVGLLSISKKQLPAVSTKYLRFLQNRKDSVMKDKSQFY